MHGVVPRHQHQRHQMHLPAVLPAELFQHLGESRPPLHRADYYIRPPQQVQRRLKRRIDHVRKDVGAMAEEHQRLPLTDGIGLIQDPGKGPQVLGPRQQRRAQAHRRKPLSPERRLRPDLVVFAPPQQVRGLHQDV